MTRCRTGGASGEGLLDHDPPDVGQPLVAAAVGYVSFLWVESRVATPLMRPRTLARRPVVSGMFLMLVATGLMLAALLSFASGLVLDTVTRALGPLRRIGVDPDRIGLMLALAIRCIPILATIVREVSEARKARGLQWSMTALATPVLVRALRTADAMGDALVARGVDDD